MNYSFQTDLYQINMAYAYFKDNIHHKNAVFELYYRINPFNNGYGVFAGIERIVNALANFTFTEENLEYLRQFNYDEDYLDYLRDFKFSGNIKSVREGEIVFANEPLLIVEANLIEAQLIETLLLNIVNFQTLIATKASRIINVVKTGSCVEFGARRAQEMDAAIWGARSAYIAGFDGTSLIEAGKRFNIPVFGTHAHSYVQVYQDEYLAFKKYAKTFKEGVLLIDTYDTINSGIVNAIKVADECKDHFVLKAVRIDSGDLAYTSKKVREILDANGYEDVKIIVSNDLDETTIASLILEGAKIDTYGIGTKLITSFDQPALGAVYKLVQIDGTDVIKISNNIEKITTPGKKRVYRVINQNGKSEGDLITLFDEEFDQTKPIKLFSEKNPLLCKYVSNYTLEDIHISIFENGECVYDLPSLAAIRDFHLSAKAKIWEETLRYSNPAKYYVDLSERCFENKNMLIKRHSIL